MSKQRNARATRGWKNEAEILRKRVRMLELENKTLKAKADSQPALLTVSHNLAETMGIDYAIKKLSIMSDDTMALGAATILKGIQNQAKAAIVAAAKEKE